MKKIIVTSIALAMSASVGAQSLDIANDRPVVASPVVAGTCCCSGDSSAPSDNRQHRQCPLFVKNSKQKM